MIDIFNQGKIWQDNVPVKQRIPAANMQWVSFYIFSNRTVSSSLLGAVLGGRNDPEIAEFVLTEIIKFTTTLCANLFFHHMKTPVQYL